MPATFNVAAGDVPGLYAALDAANANGEEDTINLAAGATYTLAAGSSSTGTPTGLTVLADGGKLLTVNGNGATIARAAGAPGFRIVAVDGGAAATLSGLTLTNGNVSADTSGQGGGVYNAGALTLTNSTLSGNAAQYGGGVYNAGTLTLSNSTLSGNSATGDGGGIYSGGTSATVTNATVTADRADADADAVGRGGGIFASTGTLNLRNTLVAGNFHGAATARDDVFGAVQAGAFNLVGDGTGLTGISDADANGNQVGTALAPIDPRLGSLQDNGGPTATHALLSGSPAIDHGLDPGAPALDQRGVGRSGPADVGAFEFVPVIPPAPPPPPAAPAPARAIVAVLVTKKSGKKKHLLFVRVSFADTGALKAEVRSPFQMPPYRAIAVAVFDSDADGVADAVRLTAKKGKKPVTSLLAV